jgi:tetratricopeptide (TPR) repeat protein
MSPQPSSQSSPSLPTANQPGKTRYRYPRPLFWIVLFGFFVPYGIVQIPREIGRWHLASAVQLRAKGETESAYKELDAAAYWFANSPELLLQRAEWSLEDGKKDEALADCDAMLTAAGDNYKWLSVHASFLQHAGNFERAVSDWKKIEEFSQRSGIPNRATALNGIAYARALAKSDFEEALRNVNEALELVRDNPNILDTRGYILFLQTEYEAALEDLDLAAAEFDKQVELADEMAKRETMSPLYRRVVNSKPKHLLEFEPPRDAKAQSEVIRAAAAVVHYHRSLVLKALDRKEDAQKDWEIAKKLVGREPDESLF